MLEWLAGVAFLAVALLSWTLGVRTGRSDVLPRPRRVEDELRREHEGRDADRHEADRVRQKHDRLEGFVKELPYLLRELGQDDAPSVPIQLLRIVQRTLDPEQALVLVSAARGTASREPEAQVVAAVSAGAPVRVGTTILPGEGAIGRAVDTRLVLTRRDFEAREPLARQALGEEEGLPGLSVEIVAPMLCGEQVVGALALSVPRRDLSDPVAIARLLAQVGALALRAES